MAADDTTRAGDAFDAGFIAGWLGALASGHAGADALHRATLAGHRTAARHLQARGRSCRRGERSSGAVAELLEVAPEVRAALAAGRAVVALGPRSSAASPYPANLEVATASEAAVRESGAVPATVAIRVAGSGSAWTTAPSWPSPRRPRARC